MRKSFSDNLLRLYGATRRCLPFLLRRPLGFFFYITGKCNLNCSYCWQRADDSRKDGWLDSLENELTPEQWVRAVEQLPRPSFLGLSGGEASISRAFAPILKTAQRRGIAVTVNSNGNVLRGKNLDVLLETGVRNLSISLDGFSDIHDAGRNAPGLFDQVVAGLAEFNARRDSARTSLTIKTVLLNENLDKLPEFKRFCEQTLKAQTLNVSFAKEGDHAQFALKYAQDFDAALGGKTATLYKYRDPEAVVATVSSLLAAKGTCEVTFYPGLDSGDKARRLLSSNGERCYESCCLPLSLGVALPDGTVIPCLSASMGNMREHDFSIMRVLASPRATSLVTRLVGMGHGLPRTCNVCCFLRVK